MIEFSSDCCLRNYLSTRKQGLEMAKKVRASDPWLEGRRRLAWLEVASDLGTRLIFQPTALLRVE